MKKKTLKKNTLKPKKKQKQKQTNKTNKQKKTNKKQVRPACKIHDQNTFYFFKITN